MMAPLAAFSLVLFQLKQVTAVGKYFISMVASNKADMAACNDAANTDPSS